MATQATIRDPIKFLELYRKIECMNPQAYGWFCGIVDSVNLAFEIAEKSAADDTKQEVVIHNGT